MIIRGPQYDRKWTDAYGDTVYERAHALGSAAGPARWTDTHDCNPICGHHLAAMCRGCSTCLTCDGCNCRPAWDE